jgi:periplasmic copper chaperone A
MLRMLVLPLLLTLCGTAHADKRTYKIGPLIIEAPWARATSAGAKVGAGYVKITNTGQEPDRLIGGSVSLATEVAVHEMAMRGGIAKMRRLEGGLEIWPGQTKELKPGGYHLMFMGLRQGLREGETMKGTLVFEKAGTVGVEYHVMRIGAQ